MDLLSFKAILCDPGLTVTELAFCLWDLRVAQLALQAPVEARREGAEAAHSKRSALEALQRDFGLTCFELEAYEALENLPAVLSRRQFVNALVLRQASVILPDNEGLRQAMAALELDAGQEKQCALCWQACLESAQARHLQDVKAEKFWKTWDVKGFQCWLLGVRTYIDSLALLGSENEELRRWRFGNSPHLEEILRKKWRESQRSKPPSVEALWSDFQAAHFDKVLQVQLSQLASLEEQSLLSALQALIFRQRGEAQWARALLKIDIQSLDLRAYPAKLVEVFVYAHCLAILSTGQEHPSLCIGCYGELLRSEPLLLALRVELALANSALAEAEGLVDDLRRYLDTGESVSCRLLGSFEERLAQKALAEAERRPNMALFHLAMLRGKPETRRAALQLLWQKAQTTLEASQPEFFSLLARTLIEYSDIREAFWELLLLECCAKQSLPLENAMLALAEALGQEGARPALFKFLEALRRFNDDEPRGGLERCLKLCEPASALFWRLAQLYVELCAQGGEAQAALISLLEVLIDEPAVALKPFWQLSLQGVSQKAWPQFQARLNAHFGIERIEGLLWALQIEGRACVQCSTEPIEGPGLDPLYAFILGAELVERHSQAFADLARRSTKAEAEPRKAVLRKDSALREAPELGLSWRHQRIDKASAAFGDGKKE